MRPTNYKKKFWLPALLMISLQSLSLPAWASPSKITVRPTIVVSNPKVDASCLLENSAPSPLKEALTKIPVGVIANPLGELQIPRDEILSKLGVFADSFELPRRIQILRKGDILSVQEIAGKIIELSNERMPAGQKAEIDRTKLPPHVVLPGKIISWSIKPMSSNPLGMNLFTLEAECDGGVHRQILQTNVWTEIKAAKIKRLISRGETITPGDIEIETVKVKNFSHQNLLSFEEAIGKKLSVYKSPGSLLRSGDTAENNPAVEIGSVAASPQKSLGCAKENWIIKPGQNVQFHVKTGTLTLSVPAKAVDGGCVGDSIKLVNLQNHRNLDGVIVGEGQVEYVQK